MLSPPMKLLALKLLVFSLIFITTQSKAATIDTVLTYSAAMHKNIKAVVVRPQDYSSAKKFPGRSICYMDTAAIMPIG